jgi:hypothetical protein
MRCWNSALNAQGSRVIIVQVGAVKTYMQQWGGAQAKGTTRWSSVHDQNWWKKLVWVPVILLCVLLSFSVTRLMAYYAKTGRFRPPNRVTLQITLLLFYWKTAICA